MIEFLTILSGVALFSLVFVPDPDRNVRNSAVYGVGGVLIFGYGVAMAMADSGTWFYSWFILAIPLFAAFQWYAALRDSDTPTTGASGLPPSLKGSTVPPAAPAAAGADGVGTFASGTNPSEAWTDPIALAPDAPEDSPFAPWDPTAPKG